MESPAAGRYYQPAMVGDTLAMLRTWTVPDDADTISRPQAGVTFSMLRTWTAPEDAGTITRPPAGMTSNTKLKVGTLSDFNRMQKNKKKERIRLLHRRPLYRGCFFNNPLYYLLFFFLLRTKAKAHIPDIAAAPRMLTSPDFGAIPLEG